jgi:hypothetical protein
MTSTIDFPCPAIGSGINVVVTPGDNILNCAAAWQNIAEELSSESETDDSDSGDNGAEINAIQRMNAASSPIVEETVRCEFEARGTREVPVNERANNGDQRHLGPEKPTIFYTWKARWA